MAFIIPLTHPWGFLVASSFSRNSELGILHRLYEMLLRDSLYHCSESFTFLAGLLLSILRIFSP